MEQYNVVGTAGGGHSGGLASGPLAVEHAAPQDARSTAERIPPRGLAAYPELARLWAFWQARADGRTMPTRQDLDTVTLGPWLGHLLLIDVTAPGQFVFRVYGTRVAHLFQHDFQNREVAELPQPARRDAWTDCTSVVRCRAPQFAERQRTYRTLRDFTIISGKIGVLNLPLSADGRSVSQILTAIYPRAA